MSEKGLVSYGSGTLFDYEGRHYIVTAAHVITNPDEGELVVWGGSRASFSSPSLVYTNPMTDLAVLLIPHVEGATSIPFREGAWRVGGTVWYAGSPNFNFKLAIQGSAAGPDPDNNWVVQGFAWSGSSGAAVFDYNGGFLGVVSRIDLDTQSQVPLENLFFVPEPGPEDALPLRGILRLPTP